MSSPVDKIKEKLGVVEVIATYIKLEKAGNNFKGRCPFHNEKTPSFFVAPDKGFYYCFGCGAKGDIFNFVQNFEGIDFKGALKLLADRAGVELTFEKAGVRDERDRLLEAMEAATIFFQSKFNSKTEPYEYIIKRGLTPRTIQDWRLGLAPDTWRELSEHLRHKGFSDVEMETAGLLKRTDTASYDRFRGRIIFPIFDTAGRVIAFSGRTTSKDKDIAKYLNSPETPLFSKSDVLYGYDRAKTSIRKFDYSILVEGQMDLLMSHQAGFTNTVASSGTALTVSHLQLLKRLSNKVIMAFDSDAAGFKAAARAWKLALALGMEVKIAQLPETFDPADLILKDKEEWKEVLKNSKHIIDFFLSKILLEDKEPRRLALTVKEQILPYLVLVESDMEKSHYVSKIANATNLREEAVWEDLRRTPKEKIEEINQGTVSSNPNNKIDNKPEPLFRQDTLEKRLFGLLLWQEIKSPPIIKLEDFKNNLIRIIGKDRWDTLMKVESTEKSDIVFQAEVMFEGNSNLQRAVDSLLFELEEEILKRELDRKLRELSLAEKAKKPELELRALLESCNELSKKINIIKQEKKKL